MNINLKFNAKKVDELEQMYKKPIANIVGDESIQTIKNLLTIIQKCYIDDNGVHGVSKTVAEDVLDKYLEEHDTTELVLDIMEALVQGGFLSKKLEVGKIRKMEQEKLDKIMMEL